MKALNPFIIEALEACDIKFIGNTSDDLTLNVETLLRLLDTVYEYGETQGYMTGFYEADEETEASVSGN